MKGAWGSDARFCSSCEEVGPPAGSKPVPGRRNSIKLCESVLKGHLVF